MAKKMSKNKKKKLLANECKWTQRTRKNNLSSKHLIHKQTNKISS